MAQLKKETMLKINKEEFNDLVGVQDIFSLLSKQDKDNEFYCQVMSGCSDNFDGMSMFIKRLLDNAIIIPNE
jgi:hypothetical protein